MLNLLTFVILGVIALSLIAIVVTLIVTLKTYDKYYEKNLEVYKSRRLE